MTFLVEVHRIDGSVEQVTVGDLVVVGRVGADLNVDDRTVSRRHCSLQASPGHGVVVTDLGSANGTTVNGHLVTQPVLAVVGAVIGLGDTTLRVVAERPASDALVRATPTAAPAAAVPDRAPTVPSPAPAGFEVMARGQVEIRYRTGSQGERVASAVAAAAGRARRGLGPLVSARPDLVPVINLIDPYTPPGTTDVVAAGTVVDAPNAEIWMVVTAESPPEDPHRALALVFGSALPCADELQPLLEGYGLWASGLGDTTDQLRGQPLPHLADAEGELRGLMALSFVAFLIRREGEDVLQSLLAAPAGGLDTAAKELYGQPLVQLERHWLSELLTGEVEVSPGQFLRMSLRYLRPYKLRQVEVFIYMLLSLAFTATFPFVTQRLFDDAIPSGEFSEVAQLLLILGAAFVVTLVSGVRQAYQSAWISGAVTRDLRQSMFDRLQRLPAGWFHRHDQGDVLTRLFNDVGQVEAGLSTAISQGVFQALSLVVSAAIMLTINLRLGLIVLLGAPVVAVVYRGMAQGAQDRSIRVQENSSALLNVAAENNEANPVVRLFGLGERERTRFAGQSDRLFRSERKLQLWGGLFGLSVNLIVTLLRLGILAFGAWLILQGDFTTGGLVAFLSIMGEVLSPVTVLTTLGQTIQQSMGSLVRIQEVLDAATEADDDTLASAPSVRNEIRLAGVGFGYTPQQRALDDLDVSIPAGSRVAFVGPSGSGKSTVLRLLMRMYDPDEGAVQIDGRPLTDFSVGSWRDQLGVVFQDSFLFDTTLRENIALGVPGATEADVVAAADGAEIDAFINNLERGYDTVVGAGGGNLSGGQRQRVAIARALIRNPRVLLLDEATSALDPGTEKQINETLVRVAENRTVIAITHRLTSVVDYDRIFVIVEGRLDEQGTHEELLRSGGVYAHLWSEQTGAPLAQAADAAEVDVAAALARLPLFAELATPELDRLVARMRAFRLDPGDHLDDGGGLSILVQGRADVVATSPTATAIAATLAPGDAFGLTALLGAAPGTRLEARTACTLLVLDNDAIAGLGAEYPSVGQVLSGRDRVGPNVRGTHLGRLTVGGPMTALGAGPARAAGNAAIGRATTVMRAAEIGRATGVFRPPPR